MSKAFLQAQEGVRELPRRPSNDDLLYLYAHFKQGSEGDAVGRRPGLLDVVGRAKYDAWARLRGLSREEARERYVERVRALRAAQGLSSS